MADVSQNLVEPFFVALNDAENSKQFIFQVHKIDEDEHYSGCVWCDDPDNSLGLSEGTWTSITQIGRGDITKNASWSPIIEISAP